MNKIGKAMLCTVLTGAMAVGAAGAADLGTTCLRRVLRRI